MNKKMTINEKEYQIVKLLGKGKGGYSYLVNDGTKKYVLKQIHHEPCDYYQFGNKLEAEIHDYKRLRAIGIKIPVMLDVDEKNERILKILPVHSRDSNRELTGKVCSGFAFAACKYMCLPTRL